MGARAGIVVTGTEVLTGRVRDRNGPWLSDRLLELGVELAHITICGDRPQDIEAQLRFMADEGVDLIVTSGGLGPTADDMTVEMVARFTGLTRPFNTLGLPALSVPCGFDTNGAPIGLQLIGRPFDEALLYRIGHAYQGATEHHKKVPV